MDTFIALLTSSAGLATSLLPVVYYGALLAGFLYAGKAMIKIKNMGNDNVSPRPTWGGVWGNLFVTMIGTGLATWVNTLSTNYGSMASGISQQMAYISANTAGSLQPMWTAIRAWMLLFGVVAIWRAAMLFNRAAAGTERDGDSFWGGFWFFAGGACLVNIATSF